MSSFCCSSPRHSLYPLHFAITSILWKTTPLAWRNRGSNNILPRMECAFTRQGTRCSFVVIWRNGLRQGQCFALMLITFLKPSNIDHSQAASSQSEGRCSLTCMITHHLGSNHTSHCVTMQEKFVLEKRNGHHRL